MNCFANTNKRIVITGLGPVSPTAIGIEDFTKAAFAGQRGKISKKIDQRNLEVSSYVVDRDGVDTELRALNKLHKCPIKPNKSISLKASCIAIQKALKDSGILEDQIKLAEDIQDRTSMVFATAPNLNFGLDYFSAVQNGAPSHRHLLESNANYIPSELARTFGIQGIVLALSECCSSTLATIDSVVRNLKADEADIGIAGSVDFDSAKAPEGFRDLGILHEESSDYSPMDRNNKGIRLGEGAGAIVLETLDHVKERKAEDKIYAELIASAGFNDADDPTSPNGIGLEKSIRAVLKQSKLKPEDITFVQVHGTGNEISDRTEIETLEKIFGEHFSQLKITANKSRYGHSIHNAGFYNIAELALSLKASKATPTIGVENKRVAHAPIVMVTDDQSKDAKYGIALGIGFGGTNRCILLKKWEGS